MPVEPGLPQLRQVRPLRRWPPLLAPQTRAVAAVDRRLAGRRDSGLPAPVLRTHRPRHRWFGEGPERLRAARRRACPGPAQAAGLLPARLEHCLPGRRPHRCRRAMRRPRRRERGPRRASLRVNTNADNESKPKRPPPSRSATAMRRPLCAASMTSSPERGARKSPSLSPPSPGGPMCHALSSIPTSRRGQLSSRPWLPPRSSTPDNWLLRTPIAKPLGGKEHSMPRTHSRRRTLRSCFSANTSANSWGHCQLEQSEGDFRRFASAIHQVACDV